MDKRQECIEKINRYKEIIATTDSPYLKRDYQKALKRMQKELKIYDQLQKQNRR